jgi:hypothetical protein
MLTLPVTMSSGVNAMSTADYRAVIDVVGSRPRFLQRWENEPDLHLIKQVEQVTMLGWKDRPGALPGFGECKLGDNSDLHISDLAILGLADISLQKTARTARSGQRRSACERAVRQC